VLTTWHLRDLTLRKATHTPGQRYLSAASGLVCADGRVFVVADDEHHLVVFDDAHQHGHTLRLFEGALPAAVKARKKRKPDTETLALLPRGATLPQGALLTLGSGSRPLRCRGAWIALGAEGRPRRAAQQVDLTPLYDPLREHFDDLNIEGAFVCGREFVLLQRGHAGGSPNASVHYALRSVLAWLFDGAEAPAAQHRRQHRLGQVAGVPLCFTDGAALPGGGWVFTAVAEASNDSVADGACLGSMVGVMSAQGELLARHPLAYNEKVEGIAVRVWRGLADLCLVTDADDPRIASQLLRARFRL
jgi:hypothetical protein